ncbi:MAG: hypothetical protein KAJ18_12225, partial [Candidatus Omnitrophica bacterium]|nr:hypothetical protein [Candidatus Omnitrophota bacterium]
MADRSGDQYKKWSEHRILAGILTILQDWFGQISLPSLVDFGLRANDPFLTIAHGSNPLLSQVSHINKFGANKDS